MQMEFTFSKNANLSCSFMWHKGPSFWIVQFGPFCFKILPKKMLLLNTNYYYNSSFLFKYIIGSGYHVKVSCNFEVPPKDIDHGLNLMSSNSTTNNICVPILQFYKTNGQIIYV